MGDIVGTDESYCAALLGATVGTTVGRRVGSSVGMCVVTVTVTDSTGIWKPSTSISFMLPLPLMPMSLSRNSGLRLTLSTTASEELCHRLRPPDLRPPDPPPTAVGEPVGAELPPLPPPLPLSVGREVGAELPPTAPPPLSTAVGREVGGEESPSPPPPPLASPWSVEPNLKTVIWTESRGAPKRFAKYCWMPVIRAGVTAEYGISRTMLISPA